jgi:hypothetical protein
MLQGGNQGEVLDDIGVVAGVKCMSVTEHVWMLTASAKISVCIGLADL